MEIPEFCIASERDDAHTVGSFLRHQGGGKLHAVAREDLTTTLCGRVVRVLFEFDDWSSTTTSRDQCQTCRDRHRARVNADSGGVGRDQ